MRKWRIAGAGALAGVVALAADPVPPEQAPLESGLVETAERRLVQLDVSVTGPPEIIADLKPEDFRLAVGLDKIERFVLDNLCAPGEARRVELEVDADAEAPIEPVVPERSRASFLFYFDQHHLTMGGRARGIDVAQELVPLLVRDGSRAMVVSAGEQLRTFTELTDDPAAIEEALVRLNRDRQQWVPWVQQEESRIAEIVEILDDETARISEALSLARTYQREERWRTEKALHLFSMVLGRMADLPPPKAVIYFADTVRRQAGDHYLSFFARRVDNSVASTQFLEGIDASHAFDRVLEEATALGIRVYTVEARGLSGPSTVSVAAETAAGTSSPVANTQAVRDAQDSLVGMARETGGRSFLNGARSRKIVAEIEEDLACVYLLSFDPAALRENTMHRVVVNVDRPGVRVHSRGQIEVQSESRRLTSRLLAAFASPGLVESQLPVSGIVIPTGYEKGRYRALVQVRAPGSPLSDAAWDLGLSLISGGEVAADASGRVSVNEPGVPVVLETELSFPPGPFQLVGVAHETRSDDVGTGQIESVWPDPDEATITIGPVALVQPTEAAILRDETLRFAGPVGLGEKDLLRADLPTAAIGIVCRARGKNGELRLERRVTGEGDSFAPFGTIVLDFGEDRCVQFRDMIPAASLSSGVYHYEVSVYEGELPLASATRAFAAATAEEHPDRPRPAGPSRS
jgi:VWFA-related protein